MRLYLLMILVALFYISLAAQNKTDTPFPMPDVGDLADKPSSSKTTTCQQEPVCEKWTKDKCKKWKTKMICRTTRKGEKKKGSGTGSGSKTLPSVNPKCRSELRKCSNKVNGKCVRWTCKKDEWEDFMVDQMPRSGFDAEETTDYEDRTFESDPEMSFDDSEESNDYEEDDWDF